MELLLGGHRGAFLLPVDSDMSFEWLNPGRRYSFVPRALVVELTPSMSPDLTACADLDSSDLVAAGLCQVDGVAVRVLEDEAQDLVNPAAFFVAVDEAEFVSRVEDGLSVQ